MLAPVDTETLSEDDAVSRAALYIQDALDGVERLHPREGRIARLAHVTQLALAYPKIVALLALVGLAFFETPVWAAGIVPLSADDYPMSGLPLLCRWWGAGCEAACLVPLLCELGLRFVAQGPKFFSHARRVQKAYAAVLLATAAEAAVAAALPPGSVRLAPFLRLLCLVLSSEQTLVHLGALASTLPSIASVAVVLAAFLGLFAWLGLLLFRETAEQVYFTTMGDALVNIAEKGTLNPTPNPNPNPNSNPSPNPNPNQWSLVVLLTTANFPDVMMPAYSASRLAIVYFASFEIVGNWFLLNMVQP